MGKQRHRKVKTEPLPSLQTGSVCVVAGNIHPPPPNFHTKSLDHHIPVLSHPRPTATVLPKGCALAPYYQHTWNSHKLTRRASRKEHGQCSLHSRGPEQVKKRAGHFLTLLQVWQPCNITFTTAVQPFLIKQKIKKFLMKHYLIEKGKMGQTISTGRESKHSPVHVWSEHSQILSSAACSPALFPLICTTTQLKVNQKPRNYMEVQK